MTRGQVRAACRRMPDHVEEIEEEAGELNLVPYMDIVTNIIIFLLASMINQVSLANINVTGAGLRGGAGRRLRPGRGRRRTDAVPDAGRLGLMGEAGPEAIVPLARGADGKLGMPRRAGAGSVHVTMNITTPDVARVPEVAEPGRGGDEPGDRARAAQSLKAISEETAMDFHEVQVSGGAFLGSSGGPERRTEIVTLTNGYEERNSPWAHSRRRYDAGVGVRSLDDLAEVTAFFEARQGSSTGFAGRTGATSSRACRRRRLGAGPPIGTGDGSRTASIW